MRRDSTANISASATAPTVARPIATRLIGPYDAMAYGRLKMPTPMMLPMTRLVDWGQAQPRGARPVVASSGAR